MCEDEWMSYEGDKKVCKGDDGLVCENDRMVCEGERGVGKVCEDDQMVLKLKGWCVGVGNDRV